MSAANRATGDGAPRQDIDRIRRQIAHRSKRFEGDDESAGALAEAMWTAANSLRSGFAAGARKPACLRAAAELDAIMEAGGRAIGSSSIIATLF